jgi:hypothetical protein
MKRTYVDRRFNDRTIDIILLANKIIEEYQVQGYSLTLRQLYYQFVSRGYIQNKQTEYDRLGSIINDGRLAGLIDWDAIVDRTRNVKTNPHWESPAEILESAKNQYQVDKRRDQEIYLEVWIEKDALIGVIEKVCRNNDVPFFSCRGYTSQSEVWAAAQRILKVNKNTVIIHLGDHDPSGLDMTRDINERLVMFVEGNIQISIDRIALNHEQVKKYNPPPNPAKSTDSRFNNYVSKYGKESWELDALNPAVIEKLIYKTIASYTDQEAFSNCMKLENAHKRLLENIIDKLNEEEV